MSKEYRIDYGTEDGSVAGDFVKALPTAADLANHVVNAQAKAVQNWKDAHAGEEMNAETYNQLIRLASSNVLESYYWGWFRQVLVTYRAQAKRLRKGNKKDMPMSAAEVAKFMASVKLPVYAEPTEQIAPEKKAAESVTALTGDALRTALRGMFVPEEQVETMALNIEAKAKQV